MADVRKIEGFEEAPDVGSPGQRYVEQKFGKIAERESRSDLRDERGGATDPAAPTSEPREPEWLTRERKGPLSPTRGRR